MASIQSSRLNPSSFTGTPKTLTLAEFPVSICILITPIPPQAHRSLFIGVTLTFSFVCNQHICVLIIEQEQAEKGHAQFWWCGLWWQLQFAWKRDQHWWHSPPHHFWNMWLALLHCQQYIHSHYPISYWPK